MHLFENHILEVLTIWRPCISFKMYSYGMHELLKGKKSTILQKKNYIYEKNNIAVFHICIVFFSLTDYVAEELSDM